MKIIATTTLSASLIVFASAYAANTLPREDHPSNLSGRFGQVLDDSGAYLDICFLEGGRTAVWLSRECEECKEQMSKVEAVSYAKGGMVSVGATTFDITNQGTGLFHPSLGMFGSNDNRLDKPRPKTCLASAGSPLAPVKSITSHPHM